MFKLKVPPLAVKACVGSPLAILNPVANTFPSTSNFSDGEVIPIPTLPFSIVFVIESFPIVTELLPFPIA